MFAGLHEEHDHEHEDQEHEDQEHEDHDHEEGEHDEDEHEHEHEDGEVEYDEHVWLSLRNASVLTKKISEAIRSADPSNANTYKTNTASYLKKLETLDSEYKNAVK